MSVNRISSCLNNTKGLFGRLGSRPNPGPTRGKIHTRIMARICVWAREGNGKSWSNPEGSTGPKKQLIGLGFFTRPRLAHTVSSSALRTLARGLFISFSSLQRLGALFRPRRFECWLEAFSSLLRAFNASVAQLDFLISVRHPLLPPPRQVVTPRCCCGHLTSPKCHCREERRWSQLGLAVGCRSCGNRAPTAGHSHHPPRRHCDQWPPPHNRLSIFFSIFVYFLGSL